MAVDRVYPTPYLYGTWSPYTVILQAIPTSRASPKRNLGCPQAPYYTGRGFIEITWFDQGIDVFPGAYGNLYEESGYYYCPY